MAAPDYAVLQLDLAVARDNASIVDVGTKYNSVMVQAVPGGANVSLHFGTNKQPVPLTQGDSWTVTVVEDGCEKPANEGLYMSNPVGAGNVILVVSYGEVGIGRAA